MEHTLLLVPTIKNTGLTTAARGLLRAFENEGVKAFGFSPIELKPGCTLQNKKNGAKPISLNEAATLFSRNQADVLLEKIVAQYEQYAKKADVMVVEGLTADDDYPFFSQLNAKIAKAIDAKIIIVSAPGNFSLQAEESQIRSIVNNYGGIYNSRVAGCILNKVNAPLSLEIAEIETLEESSKENAEFICRQWQKSKLFSNNFNLIACVPWQANLVAPRTKDIANALNAKILYQGQLNERRIYRTLLCARYVENMVNELKAGTLIVTANDRSDIIIATCMAALNGVKIAGLLLTGDDKYKTHIFKLCEKAIETGLPIFSVNLNSFQTCNLLNDLDTSIPEDDVERLNANINHVAEQVSTKWIEKILSSNVERRLSPSAFRYQLTEKAKQANKHIILPEGEEPRTIKAANICAEKHIATLTLLGDEKEINRVAENNGIILHRDIQIINPTKIYKNYVKELVELRKAKGITEKGAIEALQDNIMLGTMMLYRNEVDGLVSGAVHSTANTIRPALQIIKTTPNAKLVSSIFFMCLPDQVLVYGDCAVNPDPNAEELADIAIQSADSAKTFGITPRVAMISYSTGSSGTGADVEKVTQATQLVRKLRPDILVDGPLQYDAASVESVGKQKAPNSPVAGQATVFIFPDLNTGNTTYKAVQRSANVLSIGPMLQGMRKPVNDLSRGALVEDIVYTIALTAIQATQTK